MKKFIGIVAVAVLVLLSASPVLAASLGISPSRTELEVPADGSAAANFKVHFFTGDIKVSLVDIPLKVEPETLHIESSSEPVPIQLTIYGDESLGSRIYDGYAMFLGMSGDMVAVAIKVKVKVTNLVEGETPVLVTPEESQPLLEEASEETTPEESTPVLEEQTTTGEAEQPSTPSESSSFPVLPIAGIAAGTIIIITLIVVIASRRSRY